MKNICITLLIVFLGAFSAKAQSKTAESIPILTPTAASSSGSVGDTPILEPGPIDPPPSSTPSTPPSPTQTQYCGYTKLTRTTPPTGITYYWQSSSSGTSTGNSSYTVNRTTTSTYYLRARSNSMGTWSSARSITIAAIKPSATTLNSQLVLSTQSSPNIYNQTQTMQASGVLSASYKWYSNSYGYIQTASTYNPGNSSGGVTYKVRAYKDGCYSDYENITSTRYIIPPTPPAPRQTQYCGYTRLTRATPPLGATYYWQSSSSGTSTSNSALDVNRTTTSTYYLKARDNATGTWSSARSISIAAIKPSAATLNSQLVLSTQSAPNVYNQTQTMQASGVSSATYNWYSSSNTFIKTATTYNPYSSIDGTTYKVRAYKDGCYSDYENITSTRYIIPPTPPAPRQTQYCGYTRLTRATPPLGATYYWQSSSSGTSTSNSALDVNRTTTSTYYLKARDNATGTWSSARSISIAAIKPSAATLNSQLVLSTQSSPNIYNQTQTMQASGVLSASYKWYSNSYGYIQTASTYNPGNSSGGVTYKVRAYKDGCYSDYENITSTRYIIPPTPPAPRQTQYCGYTRLTRATPPLGATYYWQSSSSGTSTSNSALDVNRTTTSTYYLKARDNATGTWSSARSISIAAIKPSAATLNSQLVLSTQSAPNVYNQTQTMQASGVSSATYNWYSSSNTFIKTATTYNPYSSIDGTTYKVRAYKDGCYSDYENIISARYAIPITPPAPTQTQYCGYTRLTRANSPAGATYYWQSTSSGTSTDNSALYVNRTSTSTYYLRARDNATGTWSSARSISIAAIKPSAATLNSQLVLSTQSAPNVYNQTQTMQASGVSSATYNWYSSSNTFIKTATTYNPYSSIDGTTYKVRAYKDGCYSDYENIISARYAIPITPPAPTQTQYCGYTRLTRANSPAGATYYWQSTSSGTSTSNSALYVNRTSTSTYFLRARDNATGTWSSARSISVTSIKEYPSAPHALDIEICGPGNVNLIVLSGPNEQINWYSGETLVASDQSSYTVNFTVPGSETVIPEKVKDGCATMGLAATATAKPQPNTPSISTNKSYACGNDALAFSATGTVLSGTVFNWLVNSTNGKTGKDVSYPLPNLGTNNVQLTASIGTCTATAQKTLSKYAYPSAPVANDGERCGAGVVTLMVDCSPDDQINWYQDGIPVASDQSSYTVNFTVSGSKIVIPEKVKDGCATQGLPVTATAKPVATLGITPSKTYACAGEAINFTSSISPGYSTLNWTINDLYNQTTEDVSYVLPLTGNNIVKLTVELEECISETSYQIERKVFPSVPVVNDVTIEYPVQVTLEVESSDLVHWYNEGTTTPVETGNTYTSDIHEDLTYEVSVYDGFCESDKVPLSIEIENPVPSVLYSINSGFWNAYGTWSCTQDGIPTVVYPDENTAVIIKGDIIEINSDSKSSNVFILDGGAQASKLNITGGTLTVHGEVELTGDVEQGQIDLNVSGSGNLICVDPLNN